jgi:hypothetical protein
MTEFDFREQLSKLEDRLAEILAALNGVAKQIRELKGCALALMLEPPDQDEAFMDELEEAFAECAKPDEAAKEEKHGT